MRAAEAWELGCGVAAKVRAGETLAAHALLQSTLDQHVAFSALDRVGRIVGLEPVSQVNALLDRVADEGQMGGWVLIGSCLRQQLETNLDGALRQAREYVVQAERWYATDILAERVPGPALVEQFDSTVALLQDWVADTDRWVRRAVGVSVHYWSKKTRAGQGQAPHARDLLQLLDPLFSEWNLDALKGIGWGLKTLGRYYPELVTDWLSEQVVVRGRRHRKLMVRKATTYLTPRQRASAEGLALP